MATTRNLACCPKAFCDVILIRCWTSLTHAIEVADALIRPNLQGKTLRSDVSGKPAACPRRSQAVVEVSSGESDEAMLKESWFSAFA